MLDCMLKYTELTWTRFSHVRVGEATTHNYTSWDMSWQKAVKKVGPPQSASICGLRLLLFWLVLFVALWQSYWRRHPLLCQEQILFPLGQEVLTRRMAITPHHWHVNLADLLLAWLIWKPLQSWCRLEWACVSMQESGSCLGPLRWSWDQNGQWRLG